jgi:hypothetical protein
VDASPHGGPSGRPLRAVAASSVAARAASIDCPAGKPGAIGSGSAPRPTGDSADNRPEPGARTSRGC